jgi:hypothetical protein
VKTVGRNAIHVKKRFRLVTEAIRKEFLRRKMVLKIDDHLYGAP